MLVLGGKSSCRVFPFAVVVGAQLLGIKMANASLASLVNAMNPISIIIFASLILKEKFTVNKIVAVIAAVTGTYIILGGASGSGQMLGIIFSLISVLTWSLMTVVAKHVNQKYDSLTITTYAIIIAAVCSFPTAVYEYTTVATINLFRMDVFRVRSVYRHRLHRFDKFALE